ncbi:MAG: DegT/DnrJ/EryC1/StrS family aminotransferase [candidate division WOR-3 bacterium]
MIPVCEPFLNGNELKYVQDAINSNWISSSGKYVEEFEKRFSNYIGAKYTTLTTSGTAALHLALKAIGIKEGDEVIVPSFTMISCAFAVCYCGAKPVFVDCDRETWTINPSLIEEKISAKTKAIMVVHIYGHPCDMDPIFEIANKYNLLIVEDAAEALGSQYKGKKCGSLGDISCFSFFANKMITSGEGGAVVTNRKEFYDKCRYFKNLCFPLDKPRIFLHDEIGFNYRMTNVQAAILLAQLEKIEIYINLRREHAIMYNERLKDIKGITLPCEKEWAFNSYWMYSILIEDDFNLTRDQLMQKLKEKGIDSRPFFIGMHRQKSLKDFGCDCSGNYPVTDEISERGLYLPSSSGLKVEEIDYICDVIRKFSESY